MGHEPCTTSVPTTQRNVGEGMLQYFRARAFWKDGYNGSIMLILVFLLLFVTFSPQTVEGLNGADNVLHENRFHKISAAGMFYAFV
jgi:hypothetical protein